MAGGNDDYLRDVSHGGDPGFSLYHLLGAEMRLIWSLLLIFSFSVPAAYTTMTIEGVKQANGVWTAAGVMDTQGFVRTTGAVSVMGATRNLPVTYSSSVAAKAAFKSVARNLGPVAIAAVGAYDVYDWYTSTDLQACPGEDKFCVKPAPTNSYDPSTYSVGYYWYIGSINGGVKIASTPHEICNREAPLRSYYYSHSVTSSGSTATCTVDRLYYGSHILEDYPATKRSCSTQPSTGSYTLPSCRGDIVDPYGPQPVYMGDTHFGNLPEPSTGVLADGFNKIPQLKDNGVPFDPLSTTFTPYSEWLGQPYFKDGNWYRDRMDISPCPTASQPTRVCVDIGPQKFDGETDPTKVPSQATGTATGTAPKEQQDFCKANPHSISCQEMGEAEADPLVPDEKQFTLDTSQSWGAANGACPASPSVTLFTGQVITFNYQPTCDFLALLRPIIIAFALMTAVFIALGRAD